MLPELNNCTKLRTGGWATEGGEEQFLQGDVYKLSLEKFDGLAP